MDILISSNLERLLYYKSGKDADYIAQLMNELEATGRYQVREDIFTSVREDFAGGYCDDAACAQSCLLYTSNKKRGRYPNAFENQAVDLGC